MKKQITIPEFGNTKEGRKELFKFLIENKNLLLHQKKSMPHYGATIRYSYPLFDKVSNTFKTIAPSIDLSTTDVITPKLAINTTRLLDTHKDVHIDGLWKRSLKNNGKRMLLLENHQMDFDSVIADGLEGDLKAYTEIMTWKELGFNYPGNTEVLVFEPTIRKDFNERMFNKYAKGQVKNHSVGMFYITLFMCINSEEKYYIDEKDNWEKYFPEIANKDEAEESGYFFAVTEGKAFEGSAVVRGSNFATPTLSIKTSDSGNHSRENKDDDPGNHSSAVDYKFLQNNLKNLKIKL